MFFDIWTTQYKCRGNEPQNYAIYYGNEPHEMVFWTKAEKFYAEETKRGRVIDSTNRKIDWYLARYRSKMLTE
ncbi:hypothetical protein SDC9_64590 [bioreactor metagenome]|uniref:Uncharacterized protein n=1 Tax=bioreactor metagenome TaxID=1076179 RepID=A0A644XVM7_9ZZZZ